MAMKEEKWKIRSEYNNNFVSCLAMTRGTRQQLICQKTRGRERESSFIVNFSFIIVTMGLKSCVFLLVVVLGLSQGGTNIEEDQYGVRYATDCEGQFENVFLCIGYKALDLGKPVFWEVRIQLQVKLFRKQEREIDVQNTKEIAVVDESPQIQYRNPTVKIAVPVPRHLSVCYCCQMIYCCLNGNGQSNHSQ